MNIMSKQLILKGLPLFSILCTIGTLIGFAVDRVSGRAISNFQFFKQGLTPDGIHYELRALRFIGINDYEALSSIRAQYEPTGFSVTEYFLNPESWEAALVDPRLLFPLLSVIFVKFLGLAGFFIIPMACFALLVLSPLYFNYKFLDNGQKQFSFVLVILLMSSFYNKFNILANTTDGLSAFLIVFLTLLLMKKYYKRESRWDYFLIPFFCLLACMTRQNEIYVSGLVIIFFLNKFSKDRKVATVIALNSFIFVSSWLIFSFARYKNYAIITNSSGQELGGSSLINDIIGLFLKFPQTLSIEFFQLFVRDIGVFMLLIIAILVSFPLKRITLVQQFFAWILFSGIILTSLNGSFGSGFRYAIPSIFIATFVILENWNKQNV